MRVGSRRTYFQVMDCKSSKLYGNKSYIDERHPHRYEVNPELVRCLEKGGLCFTGKDITGRRMETPGEETESSLGIQSFHQG
uniref:CTP synthase (glutamine hydrolyzing) n=1 Tax=Cannabis sativa TaxID=3483 RepID=A0A803RA01_CANSA